MIKCPHCGNARVELMTHGYGYGAEFCCYNCGRRWAEHSAEGRQASAAARGASAANAARIREDR